MLHPPQLSGRAALVTGGSRGIGFAIARALVSAGSHVTISGTNGQHLREAHRRLAEGLGGGVRVESIQADVRDAGQVRRMIDETVGRFGRLDTLINNAGVGSFAPVAEQAVEEWRRVIETNLTGVFHCCHAAIPHLREAGGAWIINISSLAGGNPFAGGAAYCASKAGLNAFSEALMQEVRYDDIRVSCIAPGSVATGFGGRESEDAGGWKLAPEDVAQVVLDLMSHPPRGLPSRVELRPSRPKK